MKLNLFRRRPAPGIATTDQHLVEHTAHRHFMHPTDHTLPQGAPIRGDELIWVETQIEMHAAAGTLDDGNPHILDAEILQRLQQWDQAADHEAHSRGRTAHSLHAEETQHLVRLREELAQLRSARPRAHAENNHWRSLLLGAHASRDLSNEETTNQVANAASTELLLANPAEAALTQSANTHEGESDVTSQA